MHLFEFRSPSFLDDDLFVGDLRIPWMVRPWCPTNASFLGRSLKELMSVLLNSKSELNCGEANNNIIYPSLSLYMCALFCIYVNYLLLIHTCALISCENVPKSGQAWWFEGFFSSQDWEKINARFQQASGACRWVGCRHNSSFRFFPPTWTPPVQRRETFYIHPPFRHFWRFGLEPERSTLCRRPPTDVPTAAREPQGCMRTWRRSSSRPTRRWQIGRTQGDEKLNGIGHTDWCRL